MTDSDSDVIIEPFDSEQGILNPYTGILTMPMKYPCIDLVDTSDEEDSTKEGVSTAKKRVWHRTDKQDWLKIYQEYMQERVKRQPRPLNFRGDCIKDIITRRRACRNTGKTRKKVRPRSPVKENAKYLEADTVERVKTVKDLRRLSKRQRDERETSDGDFNEDVKEAEEVSDNLERLDEDDELIRDIQDERLPEELVNDCDRVKENLEEDLAERGRGTKSNTGEPIYLDLVESDQEESGITNATPKRVTQKDLRHNSLVLVQFSNLCLFKWTKHYFECNECRKWVKDMPTLRKHVEETHSFDQIKRKMMSENYMFYKADITDLECRVCSTPLNSLTELEGHLMKHDVRLEAGASSLIPYRVCTDKLVCQLCQVEFTTRYRLQKHMDGHFLKYVCPGCNMGFFSPRSLKQHCHAYVKNESYESTLDFAKRRKFKGDGAVSNARFKCSVCPKRFKSDYKRLYHLIEEHDKESQLFQCEFCPKIFMTVHWLTKHMNCVHQEELYS